MKTKAEEIKSKNRVT